MANNNATRLSGAASVVREEDLEDMESLQGELQDKIDKAHSEGRVFMMEQYVRLLATVKSEIKRLRNRFDRDGMAAHRAAQRELKKQQREAKESA